MTYRSGSSARPLGGRLVLLAPSADMVPGTFHRVETDPQRHWQLLGGVQRLRGEVYLQDGAIHSSQLAADGRHVLAVDDHAWHVASLQPDGRITGCARFRALDAGVPLEQLAVWRSALARHPLWRPLLAKALGADMHLARERSVVYAEVGGWALARARRFTHDAVDIALSTYALARSVGGCIGITTATVRNCSSRILRKLGGRALEFADCVLPSYYDPQYQCEMELLRFDSSAPNPRYAAQIERMAADILELPVLCATPARVACSVAREPVGATGHARCERPAIADVLAVA
jgi:hypothetical protein